MKPRRTHRFAPHWLLAGVLLLSQFFLAQHDGEHWKPKLHDQACQLCLHHVGQNNIAGKASTFTVTHVPEIHFVLDKALSVSLPLRRAFQSRGPPAFSA